MPHDHAHHDAGPGRLTPGEARKITGKATALSVTVALILVVAKIVAWLMSGSVAILASLADSALDLAASLITFFAVRFAAEPADAEHRFGHGKAEAFASFLQALFVALSAGLLLREAYQHIIEPREVTNGTLAIGVMVLSIVLTAGLVWVQTRAVNQTGSVAVSGDRAHYMADLASNLAVIGGVAAAAFFALPMADPIVGGGVAIWLFWSAWNVARGALDHLLDRELPDAERQKIIEIARDDDQVIDVHQLRTRAAGPLIHIQMHMDLDPKLTLEAAHEIVVAAENRLLEKYPAADIIIHPDPHGKAEPHGLAFFQSKDDPEAVEGA
ncbi:cation diffusion facilitator family transporter [Hyphobacterium sp. HN65]|uniref:Cation diffusion facilitator family transporter n=1 Tax=Hyphobacterium lacteum TaxID=3116575 RepID=A0ABU7LTQ6_9PROT|nr:cation diffusion facilitator family transporter [Hyphobacterium sp. HN65]MEE2527305.1 cation diffusion facilitator family transporter [Hyphobacterium sp. HN65]